MTRRVAVVGAGISGLAAAWELVRSAPGTEVVVYEASDRLGGKIVATDVGGRRVDLGPDAFVARRPEAIELCRELGLHGELVAPGVSGAFVWSNGALRRLPEGLALGVPTRLGPLAASGIVSGAALARAAVDGVVPARPVTQRDASVGDIVRRHLGREVTELLADPLVGGIHAGPVDLMSAAAVFPPLLAAAARRGGLMRRLRGAGTPAADGPVFLTPGAGMSRLVEQLAVALAGAGVVVRTGTPVTSLTRTDRWVLTVAGEPVPFDAVVVAVPASAAAQLLAGVDAALAAVLGSIRSASVTLVTMRFGRADVGPLPSGTGFLVPVRDGGLLTACTWLSAKWPQLARPDDVLVRVSAGRFGDERADALDDESLVRAASGELPGRARRPARSGGGALSGGLSPVRGGPSRQGGRRRRVGGAPGRAGAGRGHVARRGGAGVHRQRAGRRSRRAGIGGRHPVVSRLRRIRLSPGRVATVTGPALGAGALMALSLPPFGFWILAFPAAAVLWWRLGGLRIGSRFAAGWVFGLGLYGVGLWWVTSFNVYGGILVMLLEALAPALAAALSPPGRGRIPVLAGAMVLLEALRSAWPFGGLPLGGVALGQAAGPLADLARVGGPLALVGAVWLAGGAVGAGVDVVVRRFRRHRVLAHEPRGWRELSGGPPPAGVRHVADVPLLGPLIAAAAAVAVVAGAGVAGGVAPDGGPAVSHVTVAAVQGGGVRGLRKAQVDPATVFAAAVTATQSLTAADVGREPALVVWPEDVVALDHPLAGSPEEQELASLARAAHSTLLAGVTEPAGPGRFRNRIVAFGPDGHVVSVFDKVHRVPFGEYVPLRGLIRHLADLSAVPEDAVAGHGDGVLRTPAGDLGTMVSYEVFFADRGRVATRAGATLLVVPTNTSSYGTAQVPTQEVAADRLQALSEGRDLVQAAPTGFSDLVDHDGRVLARSNLGGRALVQGTLSRRQGRTLYERIGDLGVLAVAAAGLLGGIGRALGIGRRRRGAQS
ncbi:MAG: protoporphyrinogen oxidase [Acidimicrobiales bacterium]